MGRFTTGQMEALPSWLPVMDQRNRGVGEGVRSAPKEKAAPEGAASVWIGRRSKANRRSGLDPTSGSPWTLAGPHLYTRRGYA